MKIKQKQRAKPMRNFALSMVSPLTPAYRQAANPLPPETVSFSLLTDYDTAVWGEGKRGIIF